MSYEQVSAMSVKPKQRTITLHHYSSNVVPKISYTTVLKKATDQEFRELQIDLLTELLDGSLRVNSANDYKWASRLNRVEAFARHTAEYQAYEATETEDAKKWGLVFHNFMNTDAYQAQVLPTILAIFYDGLNEPTDAKKHDWLLYSAERDAFMGTLRSRERRLYWTPTYAATVKLVSYYRAEYYLFVAHNNSDNDARILSQVDFTDMEV